ncbi:MAG TPA: cation:proton antiporter [Candidatus Limnocylindria bacterium]|nr:cation:proton antiporter [Candidatus Limnocylindria bacterium]
MAPFDRLVPPVARMPGFGIELEAYELLVVVVGAALLIGAVVLSVQKGRPFSAAIIYLGIGLAVGIVLDVSETVWFDPTLDPVVFTHVAEFAVIVSLFGAGVKLDRPLTWRAWRSTVMLLLVAMPLTIAGVAAVGYAALGLSIPGAVLLGAALAPTDPVLADDVQVAGPGDEEPEDEARFAITSEAGLNDGLAFPFVMLALFGAQESFQVASTWLWEWLAADVLYAVAVGIAGGAAAGVGIAALSYWVAGRGWLSKPFDGYVALASILVVYGAVEIVEGYGFLAVFAAGVAFRRYEMHHDYNQRLHEFTLTVEKLAEMAVMLMLRTVLPLADIGELLLPLLAVTAGLLFLVRPMAVALALLPTRTRRNERAFIGWFGIRGIGSVYYLGFALGEVGTPDARPLFAAISVAIAASVVLHGISSGYLTRRLLGRAAASDQG